MVRLSEHHAMDCSEFLLRSVVCGASVAARRARAERGAAWRVRDTGYTVCCLFAWLTLFASFGGFRKEIEGRE